MKKIIAVFLAATFILGAAVQASAAEIKVKGQLDNIFGWRDGYSNGAFNTADDANEDDFIARTRLRTQIEIIASESLRGVVQFEIGNLYWGRGVGGVGRGSGGALDTDGVNVETKHLYLDWYVPNTQLRVKLGLQPLALPGLVFGNPVFNADVAAAVASYKLGDNFSLTGFWARPYDEFETDASPLYRGNSYDAMDLFGVVAPMTFGDLTFIPWFVYASIGGGSTYGEYLLGSNSDLYVGGISAQYNIANFDFKLDGMYGYADSKNDAIETAGWLAAAAVDYTGFTWGTPGIFGWYATGDDDERVLERGRMGGLPVVGTDTGFYPTSFGFPGSTCIGDDTAINLTGVGTWGIGAQIADLTFLKDLSHTVRFAYYQGTNHEDMIELGASLATIIPGFNLNGLAPFGESVYLTTADGAYEVNLDSKYKIYDNLTMFVEMGYIHLDVNSRDLANDDAWKAQLLFQYKF